jgi:pimeloyl-ACP methyl ester carboxylesterase
MVRLAVRSLAAVVGAVALAGSLGVAPAGSLAAAPAGSLAVAPVTAKPAPSARPTWVPCRDGFECTTVFVPLDYGQPDGVRVALSVVRLPAADRAHRIGSLLTNPGGPGGSGVDFVRGIAQFVPLELRGRFDIVGFDPRGVMRSSPLRCYDTFNEAMAGAPPFPFPLTSAEEDVQRRTDQAFAGACARHGGPILSHMSTADVARDMDTLRQALGDQRLTFLGYSYGSFLGQVYANLFPDRVRALVIDGVLDPVAWTTGRGSESATTPLPVRIASAQGASRTMGEFFRLCDAAGTDCAFSGGAARRYSALTTKLRRAPVVVKDPSGQEQTLTYADLVAITRGALYEPLVWPDAAAFFADVERAASAQQLGRRLATLRAGLGLSTAAQEPYPNIREGGPGVACSDSLNPRSFDVWRNAVHASARQYRYFGRAWGWALSACAPWPATAGQDRYLGPWSARTSAPVLVVGNFFDPATRYQGAVTASRLLPSSRLLSYAGWGHVAYFARGNYCINTAVTRYLLTAQPPAPGLVCQPEGSPFGPAEDGVRAAQARRASAALVRAVLPPDVRRALHAR